MSEERDLYGGGSDPQGVAGTIQLLASIFAAANAQAAGPIAFMTQRSMAAYRPTLMSLAELSEAWRRGVVTDEQSRSTLRAAGYSDNAIEALLRLRAALVDPGSALELLRRGDIDEGEYARRMREQGYSAEDTAALAGLRYFLPPVQDVIRFMVREVFTPEVRARFGQDEGFPENVLPLARRLGIRDEDMRAYWAAHWQLPSPEQGFQMLQRAVETGATEEDLDTLLRALDVMPFWREKLKAIAYNPVTRVDVRRLHKLGLLDHDGMVDRYQRIGYTAADAELLAQFTEKLNATEDDDALEPFRAGLRTAARSLYVDGLIDASEVAEVFAALGYTPEQAQAFTHEAMFARDADVAREYAAAVKTMYVRGDVDDAGALTRLQAAGLSQATAERIVGPWRVLREARELSADEKQERDLTRADVTGAYGDHIIDRAEAVTMLEALGYSDAEAGVLLDRIDLKSEREQRADVERVTRSLYLARRMTRSEASGALGAEGIPQERIVTLVALWDTELDARAPDLSTSQVQQAYKRGLLPREAAAARLDAAGFTPEDRDILLALTEGGDNAGQGS